MQWLRHPVLQNHVSVARMMSGQQFRTASQYASDEIRSAYGYCIEQVRKYDYDNYVWITQLPKEHRPALLMLRAFNIDTALVADSIRSKEAPLVQVRYQWWRDGVSQAFKGNPPRHPVLLALHDVLSRQAQTSTQSPDSTPSTTDGTSAQPSTSTSAAAASLSASSPAAATAASSVRGARQAAPGLKQYHLKRIIDSREADALDSQPPLGVDGLERYAEGTASQLLYLQLGVVGAGSRESDHAASHLGKAVGITTLLQGTPFHAAHRRSYMPIDLCVQHKVSQEDIYSGQSSEGLRDVVLAVASVAKGHLDEARALSKHLPKGAASVMLPSLACDAYLKDLERVNFDVFDPALQPRPGQAASFMHVLRVKYHLLTGTF